MYLYQREAVLDKISIPVSVCSQYAHQSIRIHNSNLLLHISWSLSQRSKICDRRMYLHMFLHIQCILAIQFTLNVTLCIHGMFWSDFQHQIRKLYDERYIFIRAAHPYKLTHQRSNSKKITQAFAYTRLDASMIVQLILSLPVPL